MAIGRSHLFTQLTGSVGGITYFRNRYSSIVARNRVTPVDPSTVYQQIVRARMSAAVAAWQALSSSDRQSWEFYAAATPWSNSLGQDIRLTGFNMYIAVRLAVLKINPSADPSLLKTAHCIPGMHIHPEITFDQCVGGGAGFKLMLKNPHPTDNMRCGVSISTAQNTSVNFWAGPYDTVNFRSTSSTAPGATATINYNTLTAGKRYFLRVRAWNNSLKVLVSSPIRFHIDAWACTP